ncbi:HD domain-containing protein [Kineosporia sp. A_224]|uniref:HD domain-containing protein n=1 Tax=Kineosporia sp. A_224 TaxID=1962180 RepID=UPI0013041C46|nr:HD domain-containing protein [Kineosporia sp. A_224]
MFATSADPTPRLGTHLWLEGTGGALTRRDRRRLVLPLAKDLVITVAGRVAALLRRGDGGRRTDVAAAPVPDSRLARAAEDLASRRLSPVLLNHSYRTYAFGTALGRLHGLDVDRDLLFAAAMLHDLGLAAPTPHVDFTMAGVRAGRDVAARAGLSSSATDTMVTAITLHHSPGITVAHGPVAHLLSAGAALDVVGLRSWSLPPDVLAAVTSAHPRLGFKREFTDVFRTEAAHVPAGRAAFLRRYGAFDLAVRLAPFGD